MLVGMIEFQDLCLDVNDVAKAAAFWGPALGLRPDPDRPECLVDGIDEHAVWLNVVPEPRTVKQRVHLDVHVASRAAATCPRVNLSIASPNVRSGTIMNAA